MSACYVTVPLIQSAVNTLGGRSRDTQHDSRHRAAARAQIAALAREGRSAGSAVEAETRQAKDAWTPVAR